MILLLLLRLPVFVSLIFVVPVLLDWALEEWRLSAEKEMEVVRGSRMEDRLAVLLGEMEGRF